MQLLFQDQAEQVERNAIWFAKTFLLIIIIPIRMCALYYMDIFSDVFQTMTLFINCHSEYAAYSIAIMISSFLTTAILTGAFSYPIIFG